jgi:hypothetical protein
MPAKKNASLDKQTGRAIIDGDSSPVPNRAAKRSQSPRKATRKETPSPVFLAVRQWIADFSLLPSEDDYDLLALWAMGTWTFQPSSPATPHAYPYLYITGAKGSGKSHLANEVMKGICRSHEAIASTTGATLFRMIGEYDEESGEVIPFYPTLAIDEVDAIYAGGGSNDEQLRGVGNAGYKQGLTVPRSQGKRAIRFPVYCPKMWVGIDNGRLPETLTDRAIRLDIRKATSEQMKGLTEGPYDYKHAEREADLKQDLSTWAKQNAMILRDYEPERPDGIQPRQWEITRPLVQLARAAGVETRIVGALARIMARGHEKTSGREALMKSLSSLLDSDPGAREFLTRDILVHLDADGVQLPGRGGGKGLSAAMYPGKSAREDDGGDYIRMRPDDPRVTISERTGKPQLVMRGYKRYKLEEIVGRFYADLEADGED